MKNPIHKEMIDDFHQWYSKSKALPFIWNKKDIAAVDTLYKNIVQLCMATGCSTDSGTVLSLWQRMLEGLQIANKWVYDNASPSLINSKFNEIVAALRSRGGVSSQPEYMQTKINLIEKMFEEQ